MRDSLVILLVIVGVVVSEGAAAQQPNGATASLSWQGTAGPPFPLLTVTSGVSAAALVLDAAGVPGQGFAIFHAPAGLQPGALVTPLGILDLDLSQGVSPLGDGIGMSSGSFLDPFLVLGISGAASLSLPLAPATDLELAGSQGVFVDPTAGVGLRLSAATRLLVEGEVCPLGAAPDLGLGSGGAAAVALSSPFTYYGIGYGQVFVSSEGYVTFQGPSVDFTPTAAELLAQQPRIAPAWDDWTSGPAGQGVVRARDTGSRLLVEWTHVAGGGFGGCPGAPDSNTFCVGLTYATGDVELVYGDVWLCALAAAVDHVVVAGISPGGSISSASPTDLSAGAAAPAGAGEAIYEVFDSLAGQAFDLGPAWSGPSRLRFQPVPGQGYLQTALP